MNHRDRKWLDLAHRVTECQLCAEYVPGGCEPAHSNESRHGKGASIKAHDCFHAALCHNCHIFIDAGRKSRQTAQEAWRGAADRTLVLYATNGWLKVSK
jgi:hypothetical protein